MGDTSPGLLLTEPSRDKPRTVPYHSEPPSSRRLISHERSDALATCLRPLQARWLAACNRANASIAAQRADWQPCRPAAARAHGRWRVGTVRCTQRYPALAASPSVSKPLPLTVRGNAAPHLLTRLIHSTFLAPPRGGLRHVPYLTHPAAAGTFCIPAPLDSGTTPTPPPQCDHHNAPRHVPPLWPSSHQTPADDSRYPAFCAEAPPAAVPYQTDIPTATARPPSASPRKKDPVEARREHRRGAPVAAAPAPARRPTLFRPPPPQTLTSLASPTMFLTVVSGASRYRRTASAAALAHGRLPDHRDRRRPVAGRGMRPGWPLPNCVDEACQAWARLV